VKTVLKRSAPWALAVSPGGAYVSEHPRGKGDEISGRENYMKVVNNVSRIRNWSGKNVPPAIVIWHTSQSEDQKYRPQNLAKKPFAK
jgi:hypothetical protein